ncbi:MAG: lysophospholipid acyltransferase family protein, partial [Gammaproteobacteria bacterium]
MHSAHARPFSVSDASDEGRVARLNAFVAAFIDKASGLSRLQAIYRSLPHSPSTPAFLQRVLEVLKVSYFADCSELAKIPRQGPVLVIANHPFGAIEGIILAKLLLEIRPDVKVMANHLLQRIPELSDLFIPVDPFAGEHSKNTNRRPLRAAIRWLSAGGLLLVFPAGEVSHLHLRSRTITDPRWSPTVARMAEKTRSLVLPAYIFGSNSVLFQLVGLIHPRLRTAMLPRELKNKAASPIQIRIGDAIPYQRLAAFPDVTAQTRYLRFCTYLLRDLDGPNPAKPAPPKRKHRLVPAVAKDALHSDLNALPPHQCLSTSGALSVWYAHSDQVPFVLQEIGRLRELTFRRVGEGTGKAADIDLFDSYYLHLFAWDRENEKLVGAYRMGLTDDIIARFGTKGLYTNTLFKLKRPALARLNPAIELGRSFVRPAYQKRFGALLLLWSGIGHFVASHPRYRFLFGPVSISNDYRLISQQLMVAF